MQEELNFNNVNLAMQEDENDLCHVVESEIDKFRKDQHRFQRDITEKVTQEALTMMHPSLKDMALQNKVMEKVWFLTFDINVEHHIYM